MDESALATAVSKKHGKNEPVYAVYSMEPQLRAVTADLWGPAYGSTPGALPRWPHRSSAHFCLVGGYATQPAFHDRRSDGWRPPSPGRSSGLFFMGGDGVEPPTSCL
jgi:hypothetical protein